MARANGFLELRREQVRSEELEKKRKAVEKVLARVVDGVEDEDEVNGKEKMAGSWTDA